MIGQKSSIGDRSLARWQFGLAIAALVSLATASYLIGIGGEQCEVYCGPGTLFLPLGLLVVAATAWSMAAVLLVVAILRSHRLGTRNVVSLLLVLSSPMLLLAIWLGAR